MKTILKTICDTAFFAQDSNKMNIIGIFENINLKNLDSASPRFSTAWTIEYKKNTDITYYPKIVDSAGETLLDGSKNKINATIGDNGRINLVINLQFKPKTAGQHKVELYIDDKLADSIDFNLNILPNTAVA